MVTGGGSEYLFCSIAMGGGVEEGILSELLCVSLLPYMRYMEDDEDVRGVLAVVDAGLSWLDIEEDNEGIDR